MTIERKPTATPARPDPSKGVFETMLVVGGRPMELDAHLARLHASVLGVFGTEPPLKARDMVLEVAAGIALGRLRITVAPKGHDGLGAETTFADVDPALVFPSWDRAVVLREVVVDDGLGAHKWADRRLLEQAEADPTGPVALVLDAGDEVLEASRANVFAVFGNVVATPVADGRLLPGVTRALAIEIARDSGIEVHERRLTLGELGQADEVFLTGSVRGIEAVRALEGGRSWSSSGMVGQEIAARLRKRWLDGHPPAAS